MTVRFLDLSRHVRSLRPEVDEAIASVLDSGRFVGGEAVERFEEEFARWCGARYAVGAASGTDALALALRGVGVESGDEVITAANTCVPTIAAIEAAGAKPVLVDVDERSCTLDPGALAAAVGERTRAIVPVHLYGRCADVDAIAAFARDHGLAVVEDAAQAHGAEYGGRRAGTLAAAAAFSFYPTKNLGALGDGGAVVTDDARVAARVAMLRSYGEREQYDSVLHGRNSRLDALQAAVLSVKLRHLDAWLRRRRELAAYYLDALAGCGVSLPEEPPGTRHAYHLFVVRVAERPRVRAALADARVETLVHYPRAVHEHRAYRYLARDDGRLARSERLAREVLSLPLYPELADAEAEVVAGALREAAARVSVPA